MSASYQDHGMFLVYSVSLLKWLTSYVCLVACWWQGSYVVVGWVLSSYPPFLRRVLLKSYYRISYFCGSVLASYSLVLHHQAAVCRWLSSYFTVLCRGFLTRHSHISYFYCAWVILSVGLLMVFTNREAWVAETARWLPCLSIVLWLQFWGSWHPSWSIDAIFCILWLHLEVASFTSFWLLLLK